MYGTALMIKPMKAWKLPKGKEFKRKEICESGEYFGQLKKDGYWYVYEKDSKGNSFLFSRNISVETGLLAEKSANVPHIIEFLDDKLPKGTIIVGEIYYPNKTSKDVTKIMGCLPDKAIERQNGEYGLIHFYMHDILSYAGQNYIERGCTNWERYQILQNVVLKHGLLEKDYMEFAKAVLDNLNNFIDEAINNGEEGVVLKKKNGLFIPDKKPAWNWIKFKIEDEHDVICIGFEEPTKVYSGKEINRWQYWLDENTNELITTSQMAIEPSEEAIQYGYLPVTKSYAKGWVGAIKIGVLKDDEIIPIGTVSSGLTDEMLEEIKCSPESFIGKPMAVKAMMAGDNSLRHGVFVRWRDDLNIEDCTYEKIFK